MDGREKNVSYLGVLGLGDVDEDLGGGVEDVEELHDGGAVVGDGDGAVGVVDELVHAAGAQGGADHVGDGGAGVDVAHQLRLPLRRVRPFLQQNYLRLLLVRSFVRKQKEIRLID